MTGFYNVHELCGCGDRRISHDCCRGWCHARMRTPNACACKRFVAAEQQDVKSLAREAEMKAPASSAPKREATPSTPETGR